MAKRGGGGGGKIPEVVEDTVKKLMKKVDPPAGRGPNAPHTPNTPNTPGPSVPSTLTTRINTHNQTRHVRGGEGYRGGGYMNSHEDAQSVLDAVHNGEATVLGTTRNGNLLVRYDGVTGYNNNPGAGYLDQPTNMFQIKGTANPSVVPTSPTARPVQ